MEIRVLADNDKVILLGVLPHRLVVCLLQTFQNDLGATRKSLLQKGHDPARQIFIE